MLACSFPVSAQNFPYEPGTVCDYTHADNISSARNFAKEGHIHFSRDGILIEQDYGLYDDTTFYRCKSNAYMGACTRSDGTTAVNSTALASYPGFLVIGQHLGATYTMMRLYRVHNCRIG